MEKTTTRRVSPFLSSHYYYNNTSSGDPHISNPNLNYPPLPLPLSFSLSPSPPSISHRPFLPLSILSLLSLLLFSLLSSLPLPPSSLYPSPIRKHLRQQGFQTCSRMWLLAFLAAADTY